MIKVIESFFKFLISGEIEGLSNISKKKFYILLFLFKWFLFVGILLSFKFFLGYEGRNNNDLFEDKETWKVFLNIVILAPILEELVFRYHTKLEYKFVLVSLFAALVLFHDSTIGLIFSVIYFIFLLISLKLEIKINNLLLIYFSAFLFGFAHVAYSDYSILSENFGNTSFVILSRFLSGLLTCYVYYFRGILASIIFHAAWNLLPFISFIFQKTFMFLD